ncbi:unnamed protein product [Arabidopsis thaliana]|uniref:(thale cress) hypothetical protein n=1 Tax=Arabidopsis thaliana TaxID=3702 RepID=A0A7G2EM43_ARATH|nr:unnamed protein product [Arabidopsis thaliana]
MAARSVSLKDNEACGQDFEPAGSCLCLLVCSLAGCNYGS